MSWTYLTVISLLLQAFLLTGIDGNLIRRRRQQPAGSLYGNSNTGTNAIPGYNNYPSNTNFYGTNLNNQVAKDSYGNPIVPSAAGNSLTNMALTGQQQQQHQLQQQQMYGGNSLYSNSGTNQLLRDANGNLETRDSNGNLVPAVPGSMGSSLYSQHPQLGYQPNTNQLLNNKEMYNAPLNTNNNQYGYNNNQLPNSNTYGGSMGTNNQAWSNLNNQNQYPSNTWNQNRNLNNNNNAAYSNPNSNSPYLFSNSHRMMTSSVMIFLPFLLVISFLHI